MGGLFILFLTVAAVILLMPVILKAAFFFIVVIALLLLLANLGLLSGVVFKRHRRMNSDTARGAGRGQKTRFGKDEDVVNEKKGKGAAFKEDVEVITLPETALYKDEDADA
jgi:UPF0716 family protein affecting phage T7 exclusion